MGKKRSVAPDEQGCFFSWPKMHFFLIFKYFFFKRSIDDFEEADINAYLKLRVVVPHKCIRSYRCKM